MLAANSAQDLVSYIDRANSLTPAFICSRKASSLDVYKRQAEGWGEGGPPDIARSPLMYMLAGIYSRYQTALARQGGLDYDDLIWTAADRLEHEPDLAQALRRRWPYVLEDEAQDLSLIHIYPPGG